MPRRTRRPAPKTKSLAQQQTDFTSEGAPAPGKVGIAAPVTTDDAAATAVRDKTPKPATDKT